MINWRRSWFPVWYAYCPTEGDFREALQESTDPDFPWPTTPGCCVGYDDQYGDRRVLVTIQADWEGEPQHAIGLLVHEVVHVVQWVVKTMADNSPSDEFVAYATQAIFSELLDDISKWRAKNRIIGALPAS